MAVRALLACAVVLIAGAPAAASAAGNGKGDGRGVRPSEDLSGAWQRADGSVIQIFADREGWVGITALALARKAESRASTRCGIDPGVTTIVLEERPGGYTGQILDPVAAGRRCVMRKASFTGELEGDELKLTKKRGKRTTTETLARATAT